MIIDNSLFENLLIKDRLRSASNRVEPFSVTTAVGSTNYGTSPLQKWLESSSGSSWIDTIPNTDPYSPFITDDPDFYRIYQPYPCLPPNVIYTITLGDNISKGDHPMKTLYNVVVVDVDEKIILDTKVVAENTDEAKFAAEVDKCIRDSNLRPKDVTVICTSIGQVKVKKEVQEVKVVKE